MPSDSGYIICSNHIHMFDPVLIMTNIKRQISFMMKKELVDVPILGKILLKCGAFPIDRGNSDIGAIKAAIKILCQNKVISIFPEGTRHRDGKFRNIKNGASLIAIKANVPIVPVRIIGNYRPFSKMIIRIGNPIDCLNCSKEDVTEKLKDAIEALA